MEFSKALDYANLFYNRLAPGCTRIEIVGSVKRGDKSDVHDIEILLIPKNERPVPVFGRPNQIYKTVLDKIIADLHYEELLRHSMDKKDGEKYKKRAICGTGETTLNEFCLDLFIVNEKTWGLQNLIRTGPALFGHRFVTNRNKQAYERETGNFYPGWLPNHLEYIRGETVIRPRDSVLNLELPEESDAIALIGKGWIEPKDRGRWARS